MCTAWMSSLAQVTIPTSRVDNVRDGANTEETLLARGNVNKNGFGHLFSFPVDDVVMAQPLYIPNVTISGAVHNVIYIVTQADSVYAVDAAAGTQLWWVNFTNPSQGIVTAQTANNTLPCGNGFGYEQEGIIGTPVIDPHNNTMYLVAKTVVNGTVEHNLHALDITTGADRPGSPVQIVAQTTYGTKVTKFTSLHQKNRPGLLLLNGVIYAAFGSNGCNDDNGGWVLSYDENTLAQLAIFNTSPDHGLTSIWQTGTGIAADEDNNIYVETAESCDTCYNIPQGATYSNSVLKLTPDLTVADYFTPFDVQFLNTNDLDLSSTGVLILPDQGGSYPHELIAGGKQGFVYLLDRDDMGMFHQTYDQDIDEFSLIPGEESNQVKDVLFSSPAYWNNTVYFAPNASPILAYPVSNGTVGAPASTLQKYTGAHSPSISANGYSEGILWDITGGNLYAFNATTLQLLYASNQVKARDGLPTLGHFVTPTIANGRVYVGTESTLAVYGLFQVLNITGGLGQTATAGTALSYPIQIQADDPYSGKPDVGVTLNFSDGCTKSGSKTCGTFNPPSTSTDANGNASTTYTVPEKAGAYTLTISGTSSNATFANATTTATASPGAATHMIVFSGSKQTGDEGTTLPNPLVAQAQDTYGNGVSGVTINFAANNGAILSSPSVASGANGLASVNLQLPDTACTVNVTASSSGLKNVAFIEYSVAPSAAH
ncbi:MAG TPA: Ig-like domain-containing protein [Terriglobales bacterium]|nr:Ig-like domain-containing protein [Terriglobales bacterium]